MNAITVDYESSILERIVTDPDAARVILTMRVSPADEARMRVLMEKNNREMLSSDEQAEMEAFRRVGSFLAIAQAKARLRLGQDNTAQDGDT